MIPKRTEQQHNTEWFYYQYISDFTGHTAYEVYEILTRLILLCVDPDGHLAVIKPNSLNTIEHNNYMEQIRAIMSKELNLILPDPQVIITRDHKTKKLHPPKCLKKKKKVL